MTLIKAETITLEASVFTCDMESLRLPNDHPDVFDMSCELEADMEGFGYRAHVYKQLVKNPNPDSERWEDTHMWEYGLELQERVGRDESPNIIRLKDGERIAFFGWQTAVKLPA